MQKVFMITEDGSHTVYIPELNEHYHSIYGAINESMHVYIEQGLLQTKIKKLSILEVGFGTGLNAFLTYGFAQRENLEIEYYTLEKYPLKKQEYSTLNYPEKIFKEYSHLFDTIHEAQWDKMIEISPNFKLYKLEVDLISFQFDNIPMVDLVYFDAFAPGKQPEMWTGEILHKVANCIKQEGMFLTYCAKGSVRRTMTEAGFTMERIPGPRGKKEILRGKKTG
jgi:tRNA U34 5-methylaminomethyl-2-thiouridine-forming methyltransferase MnmC